MSRETRGGHGSYERIYRVVRQIPSGKVATYGQVAGLAGLPGHARQVGYALHALPAGSSVPWHRVVNASGGISLRSEAGHDLDQRLRLDAEGVGFDMRGRVVMVKYRWSRGARDVRRRASDD